MKRITTPTAVWRNGGFGASYVSFVVGASAVLRLNFRAKIRHYIKPQNVCKQFKMRHLIIVAVLFGITSFINSQTIDKGFIGEWKLIETMIDPGDGSGEFHKVDSEKTLEIEPSGTVKSNGDICNL